MDEAARRDDVQVTTVVGVLRRRWRAVAAVVLGGVLLGGSAALVAPVRVTATSAVVVNPVPTDPLSPSTVSPRDVSTGTEAQVVRSSSVAERAAALLGRSAPTERELLSDVEVATPQDSQVLRITYTAGSAAAAADGANAFADAYLSYRGDVLAERARESAQALDQRITDLEAQLGDLAQGAPAEGAGADELATVRAELAQEVAALRRQASTLTATAVSPGEVVDRASSASAQPQELTLELLAAGAVLGLLLGCALALWRDRRDDTLRGQADLEQLLRAPALAVSPGAGTSALGPALVAPSVGRGAASYLVVEADGNASEVAGVLATYLVRQGGSVLLVGTAAKGLGRSVEGARTVPWAVPASLGPGLVLTDVGDADAPVGRSVREWSHVVDQVVLDGTSLSATGLLEVASVVDAVVVVARQGSTTRAQLAAVAHDLSVVGAPVVGGVLLGPGGTTRTPAAHGQGPVPAPGPVAAGW